MNRRDIFKLFGISPFAIPLAVKAVAQPGAIIGESFEKLWGRVGPLSEGITVFDPRVLQSESACQQFMTMSEARLELGYGSVEQQMLDHDLFEPAEVA